MKNKYPLPKGTLVEQIYPMWHDYENKLTKITRWSKYKEKNPDLRTQTVSMHTTSVMYSTLLVLLHLNNYATYDIALIMSCFQLHDYPEGRSRKDTQLVFKTDEKDLVEYRHFQKKHRHFPLQVRNKLEQIYLLQFAWRCPECFPKGAKIAMHELVETNRLEVLLFPALESFEYMFYAYEQFCERKDEVILTHVLRNQLNTLRALAPELPGFRQEVFQAKYEKWVVNFLAKHKHVLTEKEYFYPKV